MGTGSAGAGAAISLGRFEERRRFDDGEGRVEGTQPDSSECEQKTSKRDKAKTLGSRVRMIQAGTGVSIE